MPSLHFLAIVEIVHEIRLMPESGASASAFAVPNPLDTSDSREVRMA